MHINKLCGCGVHFTEIPDSASRTMGDLFIGWVWNCICQSTLYWPEEVDEERIRELESEGLTTSDAQGVLMAEKLRVKKIATWRVGDAGFTVFGPQNWSPSPETIATVRKKSDAHLIAAAPDLLTIAKLIVSEWEAPTEGIPRGELIARLTQYALEAKIAIKKAEGK